MKARFWVVCPDFVSGPHSTEQIAHDVLARVEFYGKCWLPHEVVKSDTKPALVNQVPWPEDD